MPPQGPDQAGKRQERAALPVLAPLVADRNLLLAMIVDKVMANRGGSCRRRGQAIKALAFQCPSVSFRQHADPWQGSGRASKRGVGQVGGRAGGKEVASLKSVWGRNNRVAKAGQSSGLGPEDFPVWLANGTDISVRFWLNFEFCLFDDGGPFRVCLFDDRGHQEFPLTFLYPPPPPSLGPLSI